LCHQHLLGEHKEVHQANGTLKKKMGITGYIKNNCIEPKSIQSRHDVLADELIRRKMNHKSPLFKVADISYLPKDQQISKINIEQNIHELIKRCPKCKEKIVNYLFKKYQPLIEKRAYSWSYAKYCRTNICLSYGDLIAIGNEVFLYCIENWDWERGSFCTFLYLSLNSRFHMEHGYQKIQTVLLPDQAQNNYDNIEQQVEFKMKLESLSSNAKHVVNSALNTPYDLIIQSEKETGKVNICKKRIQRYLMEKENWKISSCQKAFEEIRDVLKN